MNRSAPSMLFHSQFLIWPKNSPAFAGWAVLNIGQCGYLTHHPSLSCICVVDSNRKIVLLGEALDTRKPASDNLSVAMDLLACFDTTDQLMERMGALSGRFVVVAQKGTQTRIYPDALGAHPIYYHVPDEEQPMYAVASSSSLVASVLNLGFHPVLASTGARWLPWPLTSYVGVERLLANHYLQVPDCRPCRFWPTRSVPRLSLESGGERASYLCSRIMQAACLRHNVIVGLSGGFDSRFLLACTRECHERIGFVTLASRNEITCDAIIAKALAAKCGLRHKTLVIEAAPDDFASTLHQNSGYSVDTVVKDTAYTLSVHLPWNTLVVNGNCGEVGRCRSYKDGMHPEQVTPSLLCRAAGFSTGGLFENAFGAWITQIPQDDFLNKLDLFWWEEPSSAWVGSTLLAQDFCFKTMSTFNCRDLLITLLGVPVEYRKSPHVLYQRVCSMMWPEVLDYPFCDEQPYTWSRRKKFLHKVAQRMKVRV